MKILFLIGSLMVAGQVLAIEGLSAGPAQFVNPCLSNAVVTANGFSSGATPTSGNCGNAVALPSVSKTAVYDTAKAGAIASASVNDKNCALTGAANSSACYDFSTAVPLPSGGTTPATTAPSGASTM